MSYTFGSSGDINSANAARAYGMTVTGAHWNTHNSFIDLHESGSPEGYVQMTVPSGINTCIVTMGSRYSGSQSDDIHGIRINGQDMWSQEGAFSQRTMTYSCQPYDRFQVFERHGIFDLYSISFESR